MSGPESTNKSLLSLIAVVAVLIGLGLIIYLPGYVAKHDQSTQVLPSDPECSLNHGPCVATLDQQEISLRIKSEPIRSATPMTFEVALQNIEADQVMLDLQGKEMFMGLNQIMLEPVPGNTGIWQGQATLAICTTGEMVWVSSIVLEKDGRKTQANFEFTAR